MYILIISEQSEGSLYQEIYGFKIIVLIPHAKFVPYYNSVLDCGLFFIGYHQSQQTIKCLHES